MEGFDISNVIENGILVSVLWWFMFRVEKTLKSVAKNMNLMARAIIRLLERHDPQAASDLSKELYHANGDSES